MMLLICLVPQLTISYLFNFVQPMQILKGKTHLPSWLVLCMPILANAAFGLYPVVVKIFASAGKEKANSYIFTLYRAAGSFPVLFLTSHFVEGRVQIPDSRTTAIFVLLSFLNVFLGQCFYITGVDNVGPDVTSSLQPLIAVWTAVIAVVFRVEKFPSFKMLHTYAKLAGIVISVVGAASLISGSPPEGTVWQRTIGYGALFLDTLVGAIVYVVQKKLIFNKKDCKWKAYPMAMVAYMYFFGFFILLTANLYYVFTGQSDLFLIPKHSLPALVYAVFIVSALGYYLIAYSVKLLPPSVVTAMWPVQMLVTVVSAYIFIGDEFTSQQFFGAVLIIVGIFFVLYSNHIDEQLAKGVDAGTRLEDCCSNNDTASEHSS